MPCGYGKRVRGIFWSLFVGGALWASALRAGDPLTLRVQETGVRKDLIRAEVHLVNVPFTVHDKRGHYINSLSKEDFEVYENGAKQAIELFGNYTIEEAPPLTIALLVDTSGSERLRMGMIKQTAVEFINTIVRRNKDKSCLIQFDEQVRLVQDFTTSPEELARAIRTLQVGTSTALYDALHWAVTEKLSHQPGRKVVVILTDGDDTSSRIKRSEAIKAAQQADAAVYAVGIWDPLFGDANFGVLKNFAKETGGRFYKASSDITTLRSAFQVIDEDLKNQYGLGYVSTHQKKDGTFRKIVVRTRVKGLEVKHRRGYYAPTP